MTDSFLDALAQEMENKSKLFEDKLCDTVYLGGGTPSVLSGNQLKSIIEAEPDIQYFAVEKDKIDILKNLRQTLVLADDVSNRLCDSSNVVLRVSAPFIEGAQIATHLPLLGEKGTDFLLETVEAYYQTLA